MKAIVWTNYGPPDVLKLKDVPKPIPKDNQVLIKVSATTAFAGDVELRGLNISFLYRLPLRIFVGFVKPKRITILGQELAGVIEAVGKDVKLFKVGDRIFGGTGFGMGAYAEYICLPEKIEGLAGPLAIKPTNMSYEEAATVCTGGLDALHFIRKANIQLGEKVLINGAGGSIGTYAVQLAKHLGAEVTGVDHTEKLDMILSIGADHVIDYTQHSFTSLDETYDVIYDVVGKSPFSGSINSLNQNGRYLIGNPKISSSIRGSWVSKTSSKSVVTQSATQITEDLLYLKELIEAGKLKSIIDKSYPLEETAEAHRYVESGNKKGHVIINVNNIYP